MENTRHKTDHTRTSAAVPALLMGSHDRAPITPGKGQLAPDAGMAPTAIQQVLKLLGSMQHNDIVTI